MMSKRSEKIINSSLDHLNFVVMFELGKVIRPIDSLLEIVLNIKNTFY